MDSFSSRAPLHDPGGDDETYADILVRLLRFRPDPYMRLTFASGRAPGSTHRHAYDEGMHVLVAEDDGSVAAALVSALQRAGHSCTRVARGSDVLLRHRDAQVVLLDLGLEDMDGLDALRRLRAVSEVPVIVVTARGDEHSTVKALSLGADDYLVKPVRLHELLARLVAVTRRYTPPEEPTHVRVGTVDIDIEARRVSTGERDVSLTPNEFGILVSLARRAGQIVTRRQVLDEVWGDAYATSSRSFDVHLGQLRQKLPEITITTVRGVGYRCEGAG
ncbi:DNA-binding response regulator, OmpR family, contains REC and winged-helix (wHTH) domain [Microbacterium enclense]|uniref:DNA-binding response regulator, OmpR family, contains REC and winged-helix (WHTH) domain n=2 Tax=Microbacterium enclense TaxID=993073 RepID=A0A1G6HK51_9MICO|nr:DNA-binding response regulator, OmpR family, contains REC and winged-helix (wHTH) domain [Microbacterium enclense]